MGRWDMRVHFPLDGGRPCEDFFDSKTKGVSYVCQSRRWQWCFMGGASSDMIVAR